MKIYELEQDELFFSYQNFVGSNKNKFKQRDNKSIDSDEQEFSRDIDETYKAYDAEYPFLNGYSNSHSLHRYISSISEVIKLQFYKLYINTDTNTIMKYKIDVQPFKNNKCKIFISHSHNDAKMILKLAEWIKRKSGKACFIDSQYWPYFNDVIEECINKLYIEHRNYNYSLCDISKRVRDIIDIYLLEALQNQMLYSDIILIVKTNNYTYESPWIRYERNVIDYICDKYKCEIKHVSVNDLIWCL